MSPSSRKLKAGFTLFETLVAFAILTLIVSTSLVVTTNSISLQSRAGNRLDLQELGHAVLTEFVTTYPQMKSTGFLDDQFSWEITEETRPIHKENSSLLSATYKTVTIKIRASDTPERAVEMSTVFAVRNEN